MNDRNDICSGHDDPNDRSFLHIWDQLWEKWCIDLVFIVRFKLLFSRLDHFQGCDLVAFMFDTGDDIADVLAFDAIWFN